jgi:hypothetical protein
MTLERLILNTLLNEALVTPASLARLWGADRILCQDWLQRFVKRGLCGRKNQPVPKRAIKSFEPVMYFAIDQSQIRAYLESNQCRI